MLPRWLPLYLVGIISLTLFPFLPSVCESGGWVLRKGLVDIVANLLAFMPIGLALRRLPPLRALVLAIALSLAIELCQEYLPRQQDVSDLISNALGAFLGHRLGVAWATRWQGPLLRPVTRRILLWTATAALLIGALAEAFVAPANDFSNWAGLPLVIGNSVQGNRSWVGEISEVAIFDRALDADDTPRSPADPAAAAFWAEGGPILWLHFGGENPSGRVDGPSGPVRYLPEVDRSTARTQAGLQLLPSGIALEGWVSDHVVGQLKGSGEVTLDVHLRAAAKRQFGPAQIVSVGNGRGSRNLILAQQGSGLTARLRTPANGGNSAKPETATRPGVITREPQHIRLAYDGSWATIHVDGSCEGSSHIALASALPMMGPFLGLTLVLCTALSALALASFSSSRRRRLVLAALGGCGAWTLLWASGIWSYLGDYTLIAFLIGAFALLSTLPLLLRPR